MRTVSATISQTRWQADEATKGKQAAVSMAIAAVNMERGDKELAIKVLKKEKDEAAELAGRAVAASTALLDMALFAQSSSGPVVKKSRKQHKLKKNMAMDLAEFAASTASSSTSSASSAAAASSSTSSAAAALPPGAPRPGRQPPRGPATHVAP